MKIRITERYPNGLGFYASIERVRFTIGVDRAIKKLTAVRLRNDQATHFWELKDFQEIPETEEKVAELVGLMWRDRRGDWKEI